MVCCMAVCVMKEWLLGAIVYSEHLLINNCDFLSSQRRLKWSQNNIFKCHDLMMNTVILSLTYGMIQMFYVWWIADISDINGVYVVCSWP